MERYNRTHHHGPPTPAKYTSLRMDREPFKLHVIYDAFSSSTHSAFSTPPHSGGNSMCVNSYRSTVTVRRRAQEGGGSYKCVTLFFITRAQWVSEASQVSEVKGIPDSPGPSGTKMDLYVTSYKSPMSRRCRFLFIPFHLPVWNMVPTDRYSQRLPGTRIYTRWGRLHV